MSPIGATAMSTPAGSCRLIHTHSGSNSDSCFRHLLACRHSISNTLPFKGPKQHAGESTALKAEVAKSYKSSSFGAWFGVGAGRKSRFGGTGGAGGTAFATYTSYAGPNSAAGTHMMPV